MIRWFLTWFKSTGMWIRFARHWVGYFTFRWFGYPKFPMQKYFKIVNILAKDPNAVYAFVAADRDALAWKLTHLVSDTQWGHAGLILFEEGQPWCYHMKSTGLMRWHILDLLREVDSFGIVKLPLDEDGIMLARYRLNALLRAPNLIYDYRLEMSDDILEWVRLPPGSGGNEPQTIIVGKTLNIYCSELVYIIGYGLIKDPDFKPKLVLQTKAFNPDQVLDIGQVVFLHLQND